MNIEETKILTKDKFALHIASLMNKISNYHYDLIIDIASLKDKIGQAEVSKEDYVIDETTHVIRNNGTYLFNESERHIYNPYIDGKAIIYNYSIHKQKEGFVLIHVNRKQ